MIKEKKEKKEEKKGHQFVLGDLCLELLKRFDMDRHDCYYREVFVFLVR
jgi:hypothetical protein